MPELSEVKWRAFKLSDEGIFSLGSTLSGIDKNKLKVSGVENHPYITRTDFNNGLDIFVGDQEKPLNEGNVISIGLDTQTVFYQEAPFYTGQNVQILSMKALTRNSALFVIPLIKKQLETLSWGGNGATLGRLKKKSILLPVNEKDAIDLDMIEAYMRVSEAKVKAGISHFKKHEDVIDFRELSDMAWEGFKIGTLFPLVEKGTYLPARSKFAGVTPYITAKQGKNGVDDFIGNEKLFSGNRITVEKIGFKAYYQAHEFYCSHDVTVLAHDEMNAYNGQFLAATISNQGSKYSYARQAQKNVTKATAILLPVDDAGEPDWFFMEQYIKRQENKILDQVEGFFK